MESEKLSERLEDPNPFEAVGSVLIALSADPRRANSSRQFYENAIRAHELDPTEVRERFITRIRECERILQLPFLPEHSSAVEFHQTYLLSMREAFYTLALSVESTSAQGQFMALWDNGRWSIMTQSVKSFRNEYQNYQLIELVKRYLTAIRQFLLDTEQSQTVNDALDLLDDLLRDIDEELWKSSWEDYEERFAVLDVLLRTESEKTPGTPFSTYYQATRRAVWRLFIKVDRTLDVALLVPRAITVVNIGLALLSGSLPLESGQAEEIMALMPQLETPDFQEAEDSEVNDSIDSEAE